MVLTFFLINPIKVDASHRYTATNGTLVVGTEATINSGSTSGNVGSWYGTVGADTTSPLEVLFGASEGSETVDVGYQVGIAATTSAGFYQTTVIYVATPTY